jgi:hypothetical protein
MLDQNTAAVELVAGSAAVAVFAVSCTGCTVLLCSLLQQQSVLPRSDLISVLIFDFDFEIHRSSFFCVV